MPDGVWPFASSFNYDKFAVINLTPIIYKTITLRLAPFKVSDFLFEVFRLMQKSTKGAFLTLGDVNRLDISNHMFSTKYTSIFFKNNNMYLILHKWSSTFTNYTYLYVDFERTTFIFESLMFFFNPKLSKT